MKRLFKAFHKADDFFLVVAVNYHVVVSVRTGKEVLNIVVNLKLDLGTAKV